MLSEKDCAINDIKCFANTRALQIAQFSTFKIRLEIIRFSVVLDETAAESSLIFYNLLHVRCYETSLLTHNWSKSTSTAGRTNFNKTIHCFTS